jgi:hypothetical protein
VQGIIIREGLCKIFGKAGSSIQGFNGQRSDGPIGKKALYLKIITAIAGITIDIAIYGDRHFYHILLRHHSTGDHP